MNWTIELSKIYRKKNELVDIFGVILYSDSNPHIKKVLADKDYWKALDEISGPKWAIFSIRPQEGKSTCPTFPVGTLGMMIPIWREPQENIRILEEFELDSTQNIPILLIFTQGKDEEILKFTFKINEESIEKAYNSLKQAIENITECVEKILPEYRKDSEAVFHAVEMGIYPYKQWEKIKKGIKFYTWTKSILP